MPALWSMFEDNSGGFSSMRLVFVFTTIFFLSIWGLVCYESKKIESFPKEGVTLILGLGGIKMAQRYGEKGEYDATINQDPPPKTS